MTHRSIVHALVVLSLLAAELAFPGAVVGQELREDQLFRRMDLRLETVRRATYLNDGKTFAVLSSKGVTFIDTETLRCRRFPAEICVALSPDGKRLATITRVPAMPPMLGAAPAMTVWDIATRRPVGNQQAQLNWNAPGPCVFLPDNRTLAGIYSIRLPNNGEGPQARRERPKSQSRIGLWNVENGNLLASWNGPAAAVLQLAVSPDGKYLATGGGGWHELWKGELFLWEIATGKIMHRLIDHEVPKGGLSFFGLPVPSAIAFSPDGALLAATISSGREKGLNIWEVATGWSLPTKNFLADPPPVDDEEKPASPTDSHLVATTEKHLAKPVFSPDGKYLCLTGGVCPVMLGVPSRKQISLLEVSQGHRQPIETAAFSPDGKVVATVAKDGIRFWNLAHDQFGMKPRDP